jgi:phospholipid transport system substrate-binding protein
MVNIWRHALAGFSLATIAAVSPAAAQAPATVRDPGQFIAGLGKQVIQLISEKQQPAAPRKQQFAGLVDNAFDFDSISRFILGPYWRSASEQQRSEFQQVFKTYMTNVYWSDFSQYSGEQLTVGGQHPETANITIVNSQIEQTNGRPPVKVDWRVASAKGGYKITDVSIAGVSELITYREEFGNAIAQSGGNVGGLTARLRQKIQQTGGA